jgi:hypothetical protein
VHFYIVMIVIMAILNLGQWVHCVPTVNNGVRERCFGKDGDTVACPVRADPLPDPLARSNVSSVHNAPGRIMAERTTSSPGGRPSISGVPKGTMTGDITRTAGGIPPISETYLSFDDIPAGESVKLPNGKFIVKGGGMIPKQDGEELFKRGAEEDQHGYNKQCSYMDTVGSPGGGIWVRRYWVGCKFYFFQAGDRSQIQFNVEGWAKVVEPISAISGGNSGSSTLSVQNGQSTQFSITAQVSVQKTLTAIFEEVSKAWAASVNVSYNYSKTWTIATTTTIPVPPFTQAVLCAVPRVDRYWGWWHYREVKDVYGKWDDVKVWNWTYMDVPRVISSGAPDASYAACGGVASDYDEAGWQCAYV